MSAERFEITLSDDGRIHISGSNGRSATLITPDGIIGYVTHGAIRQQARETEQLRAELQLCCELKREYQERAAVAYEQADLAAAVAERDEARTAYQVRSTEWHQHELIALALAERYKLRAEQAEARLSEIDAAPTVAMFCPLFKSAFNKSTLMDAYRKAKMPHVELIARPAKD